jgi:hypothetical protein
MNLDEVIRTVKRLRLPEGSYIVYGSGPLALHGIREVNDVDMLVAKDLKAELKASGWREINKGPNDTPAINGVVEAHDTWSFCEYSPTLTELLSRADVYKGVTFASLEDVLKWKLASPTSDKNLKDIETIRAKLSENSSA